MVEHAWEYPKCKRAIIRSAEEQTLSSSASWLVCYVPVVKV